MSLKLKLYIGVVVAAAGLMVGPSLPGLHIANPAWYLLYLVLALSSSLLKVRLPGITGTYSLNFLFVLIGVNYFHLPETVLAACGAALVQSYWHTLNRPQPVQTLFNLANIMTGTAAAFLVAGAPLAEAPAPVRLLWLAIAAFVYFVVNTMVVSGVLAIVQGKPLSQVAAEWYVWSFPYYLVGAVAVGLLPVAGQPVQPEAWLVLAPCLYLIHFFYGLSVTFAQDGAPAGPEAPGAAMPGPAKLFVGAAIVAAVALLALGLANWHATALWRFAGYCVAAAFTSMWKVRLPKMEGTVSVNFVILLAAIAQLTIGEIGVLCVISAVFQSYWNTKRRPHPIQGLFNGAALIIGTSLAWTASGLLPASVSGVHTLVLSTLVLYSVNTLLVSTAVCLVEKRPVITIWQNCCFWSLPYYLVGAAFAGVMIVSSRSMAWPVPFLALPLMALVYVSYLLHINRAAGSKGPQPMPTLAR